MNKHITRDFYLPVFTMVLLLLLGCSRQGSSTNGDEESYITFAKSYGSPLNDNFAAVSEITKNNQQQFIIAGNMARSYDYDIQTIGLSQKGAVTDPGAIWMAGLTTEGDLLWQKGLHVNTTTPVASELSISRVSFDNADGFWLAGSVKKFSQAPKLLVRRLDAAGTVSLSQEIALTAEDSLTRLTYPDKGWAIEVVAMEPSFNDDLLLMVVLRGVIDALDENNNKLGTVNEHHTYLVRVDSIGNLLWSSHLPTALEGSKNLYENSSIAELSYGAIVLSTGDLLVGFSQTGTRLWQQDKTVRQLDVSYDEYFTFLSERDGDYYFQKIDPMGQAVSNEISLSHEVTIGADTRLGQVLSYAESCRGTKSGGCELITHSTFISSHDISFQPAKRILRRISVATGEVLEELSIGDPGMKIIQVFYDRTNQKFQLLVDQDEEVQLQNGSVNRAFLTLFTFTPDLVLDSRVKISNAVKLQDNDIASEWWVQWDAKSHRLLINQGYQVALSDNRWRTETLTPNVYYNPHSTIFRISDLVVANMTDLSLPFQFTIVNDDAFERFEVNDLITTSSNHFLLASMRARISNALIILALDANGQLNWQKQWPSRQAAPYSNSAAIFSDEDDALLVAGQDVDQLWGGLLAFSNIDGSATAGVNVVPAEHQFFSNNGLLSAKNSRALYLAGEFRVDASEGIWVTKLDNSGAIIWQYQYLLKQNGIAVTELGKSIEMELNQIVADETALYLIGINNKDSDLLGVVKLNIQGELVWASQYRLGANEKRSISAVRAAINQEGELVLSASEMHRSLDPNQVLGSGICDFVNDSQRDNCLDDKNTVRRIETGYDNVTLLKLDADGEAQWTKRYGGLYDEGVAEILSASHGGYLIGGRSDSLGELGEAMLIRTDENGEITSNCQLARPATLLSIARDNFLALRKSYVSANVSYVPVIEDAEFVEVDLPQPSIARSCSGIATDPTEENTPEIAHDLFITIVGNGTVTSSPSGISCPDDCSEAYASGDSIQLLPQPESGWVFDKWSGDLACGGEFDMPNENKACVAEFRQLGGDSVTLTIVIQGGPGAGEVNSSELLPRMQCINSNETETTCTAVYQKGDNVDLVARAYGEKTNIAWVGCEEYSANRCNLNMDDNITLLVTFSELTLHTLSLNVTGGGRLFTRDGKLDCAGGNIGTCSASYVQGSSVVVEQSANNMQVLMNWSGDGSCARGGSLVSLLLTINADSQCNGEFSGAAANEYRLCTRVVNETGSTIPGTVQRSANGRQDLNTAASLNCQYYPVNSQVTLSPQANSGFGFLRWEGFNCYNNMLRDADSNQPNSLIDLPPDTSCIAVFRNDVNRLSVTFGGRFSERGDRVESVRPSGNGNFTSTGFHRCEENCNEPMLTDQGQDIWLRAIPVNTGRNDWAGWQNCDELSADPNGGPMLCRIIFQQAVGEQRNIIVNFTHYAP